MFPAFKLSRENTLPENVCDIIFEKTKGVYAEATARRVLLKRYEKFRRIHKKAYLGDSFLIKLKPVDLQIL